MAGVTYLNICPTNLKIGKKWWIRTSLTGDVVTFHNAAFFTLTINEAFGPLLVESVAR